MIPNMPIFMMTQVPVQNACNNALRNMGCKKNIPVPNVPPKCSILSIDHATIYSLDGKEILKISEF